MRMELSATKKRREILATPILLQIDADVMKLSIVTKALLACTLALLYFMFLFGSLRTILVNNVKSLIPGFIFLTIFFSVTIFVLFKVIFNDRREPLTFTENGITGGGFINAKYDQVETYRWQECRGILATGQRSKEPKVTLLLVGKDNFLKTAVFTDRFGNSIFSNNGYFFNKDQIKLIEEIFRRFGVNKAET